VLRRCAYLEELAAAALGLPLGPAVDRLAVRRSRGRYGNALQWHLGLEPHDSAAELDWEDRIEIKLVSVWRRSDGRLGCDKLKVCDVGVDPAHKLSNVLWVFADRLTRVIVGHRFFRLCGETRERMVAAWDVDPHFGRPPLFVEARESGDESAPAYYLAAHWFEDEGLLPEQAAGVFPFDARWWSQARREHGGRDPLLVVASGDASRVQCPRCSGSLELDPDQLRDAGWTPARHGMPLGDRCALVGHAAVDVARLCRPAAGTLEELVAGVARATAPDGVWRLSDRVVEPDDHLH
jgi:hypothetical protein